MLEPLGLDVAEEGVYLALVAAPRTPPESLAIELGLNPQEVRRTLRALETKGLVARSLERNNTYLPAAPDLAIAALVHRREAELKRLQVLGRQLGERYRKAMQSRTPSELIEVLVGKDAVLQRADQLFLGLGKEMLAVDRPPYRQPDGPTFDEGEIANLRRGVTYRVVYHQPVLERPDYLDSIMAYIAAGEQARVVPHAPFKLSIYDRSACLLPLDPTEENKLESVIVVHESPLLDAIIMAFELLWQTGQPFATPLPGWGQQPSPNKRREQVLAMLAAGLKDAAIARQLRIAERTVRRHIELLLQDLQATTRFQAGAEAARRGLI